jgi:hypothetical protein
VAHAASCDYDLVTSRPIQGAVNICESRFFALSATAQLAMLVHEIIHAMVSCLLVGHAW